MTREALKNKLQEIFADVFDNEEIEITEETNADDIETWDSLTHISILASVQDEFNVSFDMDEIVAMKKVGDMLDAIMAKL